MNICKYTINNLLGRYHLFFISFGDNFIFLKLSVIWQIWYNYLQYWYCFRQCFFSSLFQCIHGVFLIITLHSNIWEFDTLLPSLFYNIFLSCLVGASFYFGPLFSWQFTQVDFIMWRTSQVPPHWWTFLSPQIKCANVGIIIQCEIIGVPVRISYFCCFFVHRLHLWVGGLHDGIGRFYHNYIISTTFFCEKDSVLNSVSYLFILIDISSNIPNHWGRLRCFPPWNFSSVIAAHCWNEKNGTN